MHSQQPSASSRQIAVGSRKWDALDARWLNSNSAATRQSTGGRRSWKPSARAELPPRQLLEPHIERIERKRPRVEPPRSDRMPRARLEVPEQTQSPEVPRLHVKRLDQLRP